MQEGGKTHEANLQVVQLGGSQRGSSLAPLVNCLIPLPTCRSPVVRAVQQNARIAGGPRCACANKEDDRTESPLSQVLPARDIILEGRLMEDRKYVVCSAEVQVDQRVQEVLGREDVRVEDGQRPLTRGHEPLDRDS